MSYPTVPAFTVAAKGWDDNMLVHPMSKFLHAEEKLWDAKEYDKCEAFFAPEFVYTKSTGQAFSGNQGFKQVVADYALFAEHFHEPEGGVITETDNGYCLMGHVKLFVNLPVPGDKKFEDLQGRKWECVSQAAFKVYVKKDADGPEGLRFVSMQTFADPTPILAEAIKRGVIPVEALTG